MYKKRIVSRLLNALVLTVLVLGSTPATGQVLSKAPADLPDAPQAPPAIASPAIAPPPWGTFGLTPPDAPPAPAQPFRGPWKTATGCMLCRVQAVQSTWATRTDSHR